MKPIINKLSNQAGMIIFPILFLWKKKKYRVFLLLSVITVLLTGCFNHFFRTGTLQGIDAAAMQRLQSQEKYFILHVNDGAMAMDSVKIQKDRIDASLSALPAGHLHYLNPKIEKANLIKAKEKNVVLAEVHLYYTGKIDSTQSHFSAGLSEFNRVDVYEFDPKTTTFNHVMSVAGIIAGTVAIIGLISLIALAIACNCPQVYVDNGNNYEFVSGIYSGSIYASMERTDYLPLPALQTGNELKLKIDNVKNEVQYINRIQLMKVQHREGVKVLANRQGKVFTCTNLQTPFAATNGNSTDVKKLIVAKDNETYSFNSTANENGLSNAILIFKKPADVKKARLVVHGGNSLWSGYIYHRFAEMFGNKYETWRDQKDKSDPKEMEQWQKDQALPLMVYIEKNGNWEAVDYFAHTGNTAARDMIMEIDLSTNKDVEIKIKLETVYQFWNLDYAAMDFSVNEETTVLFIHAQSALKSGNTDQTDALKESDKAYCQLQQDDALGITFTLPDNNNNTDSYFLISTGYYHNIQKYEGAPDLKTLNSFKSKGSFDAYSRQQFSIIEQSLVETRNVRSIPAGK